MIAGFDTSKFHLEYKEDGVDTSILWERHCHGQFEMIAVVDGDITVVLEGQTYRLQRNRVIIIPPLFYHSIAANGKGTYRRITALLGVDAIPTELRDAFMGQGRSTVIPSPQLEKLKKICRQRDGAFYEPLLHSLMIEILYDLLQVSEESDPVEVDEFLQEALSYIDGHLGERILLDDLARATNRSKSSFCHLFEEKMKISPKQYILQKKLALADKLINEGMPRTAAAMQVGYENYSNFYRLYLKHHGASAYQKKPK